MEAERLQNGIPVIDSVVTDLIEVGKKFNVEF